MPTIFDHISAKSKTAIRKTLRASLEEQFAQATSLVDDLCGKMYATQIRHEECLRLYKDIKVLLMGIGKTFANYAESRRRTIGVDADGDISFVKKLLDNYKLKIKKLAQGLNEATLRELRFAANETEKQAISIFQSFSSKNKDTEVLLETLQRQYDELEHDVYGPQSDEVVVKRFNQQFYDVTQSVESGLREVSTRSLDSFLGIDFSSLEKSISEALSKERSAYSLLAKILSPFKETKKKEKKEKKINEIIREEQIELFKPLWSFLGGRFIELCNKPQELAREIYDQQIDNELVEDMMTRLCLWKYLENTKAKYASSQEREESQPCQQEQDVQRRGRPTIEKFYEEYLDLDRLGEFIRETFRELYGSSIEDDIKRKGKKCYLFLSILLIALNGGSPQRVQGKIACFCRYVKKAFGMLGRSLRSFQMYISGTIKFLHDRLKSAEGDEEAMKDSALKTGTRKFYEGIKLLSNYFNKTPIYVREAKEVGSIKRPRMTYFLSLI